MGDKVLLLLLVFLLTIVKGQSQTNTENEKVAPAISSDDLQPSDSTIKFLVMDPEEEKNGDPENGMTSADDDDDDDDPEGLKMLKSLLDGAGLFDDFVGENNTEQGDSASVKLAPAVTEEPLLASNSDDVETRSEAPELNQPNFQRNSFDESKEDRDTGRPSPFMTENNRLRNEQTTENSPVFQLTQGGYQRPFQTVNDFRDQRQSFRSESAPQQAETVQAPNSNENSDRTRGRQQSSYNSIFQPPFAFQPGPVFRHPFAQQPINFANANGRIPSDIQNSFYNTQPDFSQGQYPQLENAGNFPTVFSLQTDQRNPFASSEYPFQAPFQVPVSQSVPAHMPGQIPQFFQQESSPGYSNYDNSMNPAGSGFPALFGNPQANTQYQGRPNLFNGSPNLRGNIFANPGLSFLSNYPNSEERSQLPPRFINPQQRVRVPVQNNVRPGQILSSTPAEMEEKQTELLRETPNKENPISVPFGARIQRQNNGEEQNNFERQDNVYMRYPMTEAGYATEETLPTKNVTEKESKENVAPRQPFPFFTVPRSYSVYNSPDPYRAALETVQRGFPNVRIEDNDNQNETEGSTPEQFSQGLSGMPNQERPAAPPQLFRTYPERNPGLSIPDASFYPIQGVSPNRNPFEPIAIFPENHFQFAPRPVDTKEQTQTPACAKATNDTICFEDPAYPRGEILYALNSDSFLTQRLVTPDQQLEKIPLIDQNATTEGNEENYICKSDIKYGLPLRAQNTKGNWKVIINMDRTIGRGNFKQPVRLETCRGMGDPCTSVDDIKTACVQKYSLQRLLSWSVEKGVHDDVYRLPIACSCQILEQKE